MNNEKYNLGYRLRALSTCAGLLACLVTCLLAGGCRSSRNMVQETTTVEHREFDATERADSLAAEQSDSIHQRGAVCGGSVECGRIDIERDTTGKPVVIYWTVNTDFSATTSAETLAKNFFTLRGSSSSAQTSGAVDSVSEKKEETQEEINPAIPLESLIGSALLSLVVLYVIYVIIADHLWPWIKNRKR